MSRSLKLSFIPQMQSNEMEMCCLKMLIFLFAQQDCTLCCVLYMYNETGPQIVK